MLGSTDIAPFMFHTDVSQINRKFLKSVNPNKKILEIIYEKIRGHFDTQELWFPAFNYDFPTTKLFNPKLDPIQVGVLNEAIRKFPEYTRSSVPMFSIIRSSDQPNMGMPEVAKPFGANGEFSELRRRKGSIVFFGASISAMTFIHYVEELVGIPYRYPKIFKGEIVSERGNKELGIQYLVRPKGMTLEYDWSLITAHLKKGDLIQADSSFGDYAILNCEDLTKFMVTEYSKNIFWTLTDDSRIEVESHLDKIGRPFAISDFEGNGEI
jgi:aminoglycoside N3'-acetyltransferase